MRPAKGPSGWLTRAIVLPVLDCCTGTVGFVPHQVICFLVCLWCLFSDVCENVQGAYQDVCAQSVGGSLKESPNTILRSRVHLLQTPSFDITAIQSTIHGQDVSMVS